VAAFDDRGSIIGPLMPNTTANGPWSIGAVHPGSVPSDGQRSGYCRRGSSHELEAVPEARCSSLVHRLVERTSANRFERFAAEGENVPRGRRSRIASSVPGSRGFWERPVSDVKSVARRNRIRDPRWLLIVPKL
jgi:hypothetical protein